MSQEVYPSLALVPLEKKPIFDHVIDNLYLGDIVAAKNTECRKICPVIVNISGIDYLEEGLWYKNIKIEDDRNEDISAYFDTFVDFVEEERDKGLNVLVHCANSVSRSVSLVLYYLMKVHGMNLSTAIDFLKSKRPKHITRPNTGFFRQLLKAEKALGYNQSITVKDFFA